MAKFAELRAVACQWKHPLPAYRVLQLEVQAVLCLEGVLPHQHHSSEWQLTILLEIMWKVVLALRYMIMLFGACSGKTAQETAVQHLCKTTKAKQKNLANYFSSNFVHFFSLPIWNCSTRFHKYGSNWDLISKMTHLGQSSRFKWNRSQQLNENARPTSTQIATLPNGIR